MVRIPIILDYNQAKPVGFLELDEKALSMIEYDPGEFVLAPKWKMEPSPNGHEVIAFGLILKKTLA